MLKAIEQEGHFSYKFNAVLAISAILLVFLDPSNIYKQHQTQGEFRDKINICDKPTDNKRLNKNKLTSLAHWLDTR